MAVVALGFLAHEQVEAAALGGAEFALPRRKRSYLEVPETMLRSKAAIERTTLPQLIGRLDLRKTRGKRFAYQRSVLIRLSTLPLFLSLTPISTGLVANRGTAICCSSVISAGLAQVRVEW